MAPERKYALTRVEAGDYLLPSNDGKTIWRIAKYTDGPSSGLDDWPRDRDVWGCWKWTHHAATHVDIGSWEFWDLQDGPFEKRQDAIDAALSIRRRA